MRGAVVTNAKRFSAPLRVRAWQTGQAARRWLLPLQKMQRFSSKRRWRSSGVRGPRQLVAERSIGVSPPSAKEGYVRASLVVAGQGGARANIAAWRSREEWERTLPQGGTGLGYHGVGNSPFLCSLLGQRRSFCSVTEVLSRSPYRFWVPSSSSRCTSVLPRCAVTMSIPGRFRPSQVRLPGAGIR